MYNLLISLAAGLIVGGLAGFFLGSSPLSMLYTGLVPGLIAFGAAFFYLMRRSLKQVEKLSNEAQQYLQNRNVDRAIEILEQGYELQKWQFLIEPQIDAQIGQILFMNKKFDKAETYLRNAFQGNLIRKLFLGRLWMAWAMLGVIYYKQKDHDKMKATFSEAVSTNKKESLLWNLYAYVMWKTGKRDKAIDVLNEAIESGITDKRTKKNLKALKNNRKMKMRGWDMMWYQFHLDRPPAQRQQVQFRRR
jgi:tetratricopeptide (TPR) repeat protein